MNTAALAVVERDELALASDPVAYTELALGRAVGWLREAHAADELREARAVAASMETWIKERELGFDAQQNAAEIVTRCQVEIAKLTRAAVAPHGGPREQGSVTETCAPKGRAAQEDKALAEAAPEHVEHAIAEVRAEGRSPTPSAVARKVSTKPSVPPAPAQYAFMTKLHLLHAAADPVAAEAWARRLRARLEKSGVTIAYSNTASR